MRQLSFKDTVKEELKGIKKNVYDLLVKYPELRNSDKLLIWKYWKEIDNLIITIPGDTLSEDMDVISLDYFMAATHPESIRRMAALIRSEYPELRGDSFSRRGRIIKEEVFKEELSNGKDMQEL